MPDKVANPWTVWRDLLILTLLLPTTALLAFAFWSHHASARYTAARNQLAAAGLHLHTPFPPIPDSDNGVTYLHRAATLIQSGPDSPANSNLTWDPRIPFPQEWHDAARASALHNAPAFPLIDQALAAPHFRVDPSLRTGFGMSTLNHARATANTLIDDAIFQKDNPRLALHRLQSTYRLARLLHDDPTARLVTTAIARSLESIANSKTPYIVAHLSVTPAASDLRPLILSLIHERLARAASNAIPPNPNDLSDTETNLQASISGPLTPFRTSLLAHIFSGAIPTAAPTSHPSASATSIFADRLTSLNPDLTRFNLYNSIGNLHAATTLATALFRLDHNRYPTSLSELVPTYLPSLPADPRNRDGSPIQYILLNNNQRPILVFGAPSSPPTTLPTTAPDTVLEMDFSRSPLLLDLAPVPLPPPTTPSPPP